MICSALNVPRSSFYYRSEKRDETLVRDVILKTAGEWPRYGSLRIYHQMKREQVSFYNHLVGERRVRRIMHEMGIAAKAYPRKIRTTNSNHDFARYPNLLEGLSITHPNQAWVSDITYIAMMQGFAYLAVIMDVHTRSIRGWALSRHLDAALTISALEMAFTNGIPNIHHSDQGVQYTSNAYVERLMKHGVTISMASAGCPEENGYAERLMRTIKEEHVSLTEYENFADAKRRIAHFIEDVYQFKRIHSSLGFLTPSEFEAQCPKDNIN